MRLGILLALTFLGRKNATSNQLMMSKVTEAIERPPCPSFPENLWGISAFRNLSRERTMRDSPAEANYERRSTR